jgi:hypothetical protein
LIVFYQDEADERRKEKANAETKEEEYDEEYGYGGGLFNDVKWDADDDEADRIYQEVDDRMDQRRKERRCVLGDAPWVYCRIETRCHLHDATESTVRKRRWRNIAKSGQSYKLSLQTPRQSMCTVCPLQHPVPLKQSDKTHCTQTGGGQPGGMGEFA